MFLIFYSAHGSFEMDNPRFYHYGGTLSHINLILTGSSPSEFNENQIIGGF